MSWYPVREADLLAFAANWSARATANFANYNWVSADATAMASAYALFNTTLTTATDPLTRTSVTIDAKDVAKSAMITQMKNMKRKLEGAVPPISSTRREELGLAAKDVSPSPVPPPSTRPVLTVMGSVDQSVNLRIADELTPGKRARPHGVRGAEVFSFIGANPSNDLETWSYEGQVQKSDIAVAFPTSTAPGTKVWVAARWYNTKGQVGPVSTFVTTFLAGGLAQAA